MKTTLPNGLTLEGTAQQVISVASQLGYKISSKDFYTSSTHGAMYIKDMNTTHLRNAILKQYREWVATLSLIRNPEKLVREMVNGLTDETWLNMVKEYSTRAEE